MRWTPLSLALAFLVVGCSRLLQGGLPAPAPSSVGNAEPGAAARPALDWPWPAAGPDHFEFTTTTGVTLRYVPYRDPAQQEILPRTDRTWPGYGYQRQPDWHLANEGDTGLLYVYRPGAVNPDVYSNKSLGLIETLDPQGAYRNTGKVPPGVPADIWLRHADMDECVLKRGCKDYGDIAGKGNYIDPGPAFTHVFAFVRSGGLWAYPVQANEEALYRYIEHFRVSAEMVRRWHEAVARRFPDRDLLITPSQVPPASDDLAWLKAQRALVQGDRDLLAQLARRETLHFWGLAPLVQTGRTEWGLLFTGPGGRTLLVWRSQRWTVLEHMTWQPAPDDGGVAKTP